jgi:hypothetical protein
VSEKVNSRGFNATVDQVYAAEVQFVGPTLTNTVKEACLVNFKIAQSFGSGFYRVIWWTATCKDAGDGKTTVTLAAQVNSNAFGDGRIKRDQSELFWKNIDAALKNAPSTSSQAMSQGGSDSAVILQLSYDPSGADITPDGDYAGSTPSQLKVKAGTHSVKI